MPPCGELRRALELLREHKLREQELPITGNPGIQTAVTRPILIGFMCFLRGLKALKQCFLTAQKPQKTDEYRPSYGGLKSTRSCYLSLLLPVPRLLKRVRGWGAAEGLWQKGTANRAGRESFVALRAYVHRN